jgi:hypothetical protein
MKGQCCQGSKTLKGKYIFSNRRVGVGYIAGRMDHSFVHNVVLLENHKHSLSMREIFCIMPSLSLKYTKFILDRAW